MDQRLAELLRLLDLERLEINVFRGDSRDIGSPQVYGGQVLGQALKAAYLTVEGHRPVHSLHAYFLRRGDFNAPIDYVVDRSRDGQHFVSRRVTAIQHGAQIFNLSASFQSEEAGLAHQQDMPRVPPPEELPVFVPRGLSGNDPPASRMDDFIAQRPIEFRAVPATAAADHCLWMRTVDRLPDDELLHRCLLAYASDFHLLATALVAHQAALASSKLVVASIDHAMWFHRSVRMDDWLLYVTDSPSASGARGFARGSIFDRAGRLVASIAQEGLMRVIAPTQH